MMYIRTYYVHKNEMELTDNPALACKRIGALGPRNIRVVTARELADAKAAGIVKRAFAQSIYTRVYEGVVAAKSEDDGDSIWVDVDSGMEFTYGYCVGGAQMANRMSDFLSVPCSEIVDFETCCVAVDLMQEEVEKARAEGESRPVCLGWWFTNDSICFDVSVWIESREEAIRYAFDNPMRKVPEDSIYDIAAGAPLNREQALRKEFSRTSGFVRWKQSNYAMMYGKPEERIKVALNRFKYRF